MIAGLSKWAYTHLVHVLRRTILLMVTGYVSLRILRHSSANECGATPPTQWESIYTVLYYCVICLFTTNRNS